MGSDNKFVAIGKSLNRPALVQQAKIHLSQARDEAVELAKHGWPTSRSDQLESRIVELEKLISAQSAAREESRLAGETLQLVLKDCGTYVRRLRAALRPVLRSLPPAETTKAMFKAGKSLHKSAQNMSAYFAKIRPGIEHLSPQLQAVFSAATPLDAHDQLRTRLDAASTGAALVRKRLPLLTLTINEAVGRVMTELRDLAQFARVAFDGNDERNEKFALRIAKPRNSRQLTKTDVGTLHTTSIPSVPITSV